MIKYCKYCQKQIRGDDSYGTNDEKEWWHIDCIPINKTNNSLRIIAEMVGAIVLFLDDKLGFDEGKQEEYLKKVEEKAEEVG